jgi:glucose-6-phosphate 1-dehydrogenase
MLVPQSHILIIFGASGDLTKRKLVPALFQLSKQKLLPENFAVLGVGRSPFDDVSFRNEMESELYKSDQGASKTDKSQAHFIKNLFYISFDTTQPDEYYRLSQKIEEIVKEKKIPANYIFYLATPPSLYEIIPNALSKQGLNLQQNGIWRRIVIEKPFGYSLTSARRLNKQLLKYFHEDQIYRIDHYLGKETVQNIMVTRFSNGIFEPLWNHNYIHHVEITSAESLGVENRGGYYDTSGALRDMVQNHLLQLTAIIAMEPPAVNDPTAIRNETLKIFQALKMYDEAEMESHVIRGQYIASKIRGEQFRGYREEPGVSPDSRTETYVALKLFIDNWRWGGVPFYIRTGKRLPTRVTEAVIHFKPSPHRIFCPDESKINSNNQLVIRIQPDEGILLKFGMKIPGAGFRVQGVNMDFHYSDLGEQPIPEAYQRLLLDCMNGDATLYSRGDAVEEAWKFIDPLSEHWMNHPENLLHGYPAGTWGPNVADNLIEGKNMTWRYPCKNLTNDGIYCEL